MWELRAAALAVDFAALCLVLGATSWFFFVQSPIMLRFLGRDKFVPVQMHLTKALFRMLEIALLVVVGSTTLHSPVASLGFVSACAALAGGAINKHIVVPAALQAGARSLADIRGKNAEASTVGFASSGAGNRTKGKHRTVVVFVVVMLAGAVVHGLVLLSLL